MRGKRRGTRSAKEMKEELLQRLLELNFEVAENEERMRDEGRSAGMRKSKRQRAKGKGKKKSSGEDAPAAEQLGLL